MEDLSKYGIIPEAIKGIDEFDYILKSFHGKSHNKQSQKTYRKVKKVTYKSLLWAYFYTYKYLLKSHKKNTMNALEKID